MHIALRVWCAQVRRAVVGHLMLRLAGAWEEPSPALLGEQEGEGIVPCAAEGCCAGHSASDGSRRAAQAAAPAAAAAGGLAGGVAETLQLLRRAMDPSCDLESLIMDCAVREGVGVISCGCVGKCVCGSWGRGGRAGAPALGRGYPNAGLVPGGVATGMWHGLRPLLRHTPGCWKKGDGGRCVLRGATLGYAWR